MIVFVGDPKDSIIERAIEIKASMIVLGTHGRTGLSHLLMGSTAEYVIRHSPIPVLVIPINNYPH
jgi:nucleotide-binding universal stress UspA family protein